MTNHEIPSNLSFYKQLVDNAPVGMMLVDALQPDLPITYVNPAFERITGYSAAEVLGRNPDFLQGNDPHPSATELAEQSLTGQSTGPFILRNYRKDGRMFWNEVFVTPIRDEQGRVTHFAGTQKDVTVREEALRAVERSERRYHQMFDSNTAVNLVLDPVTGNIRDANITAANFYGYTRDQLRSMQISDLNPLPREKITRLLQGSATSEHSFLELQHRLASGEIRDVDVYVSPVDTPDGLRIYAIVIDVTGKRQAALEYQALFEQSNDAVFILDLEGRHKRVNQRAANMFGYTVDELQHLSFRELVISDEQDATRNILERLGHGERIEPYERTFRRKDGTPLYTEINVELVRDVQGQPLHFQSVVRDITERKATIEALRENEAKFRLVVESSHDGIVITNEAGAIIEWNAAMAALSGLTTDQALGQKIWDVQFRLGPTVYRTSEVYSALKARILAALRDGSGDWFNRPYDSVLQRTDGTLCMAQASLFPIKTAHGYRLGSILRDVTEQHQLEASLRTSEEKYRFIAENTSDAIYIVNANRQILYASFAQERMLGYSTTELLGLSPEAVAALNHPEDRARILTQLRAAITERATNLNIERRLRHKDGHYLWVEDRATLKYSPTGEYLSALIVSRDVSARKQAEQALTLSEARYHAVLDSSMEAYYLLESVRDVTHEIVDFRIVQVNGNAVREMGLPKDDLVGSLICERFPINRTNGFFDGYKQVAETGEPLDEEYEVPPGHIASGWYRHQVTRVGDGVAIMNRNISERKQVEIALAASEERLRTVVDHSPVMISLYDQAGNIQYANPFWLDRLGWSLEEVQAVGDPLLLFFPDVEERQQALKYMLSGLQGWRDFEMMTKHHGRLRTSWWNVPLSDGRSLGIGQDISERYQMEQGLRDSEEKFRAIAENMTDGIIIFDAGNRPSYVSPSYDQQYGRAIGTSLHLNPERLTEVLHPDDREATFNAVRTAIRNHTETLTYSYRTKHNAGHYFWREDHARFKYTNDGTYVGTYIVSRDITERKRFEEVEYRLRLEKDRLEILTRFFQNAVHEFSTPLSTLATGLYLLARSNDAERRALKAKQLEDEIDRINRLLQSLVLIMKVENVESCEISPINLGEIAQSECHLLQSRHQGQPALRLEIDADLPAVMGYSDYLDHAFHELLANAYRFTPSDGTVTVTVSRAETQVIVDIHDTGYGIAEADLPYIFDTFWRKDEAHTTPGFGLGLAIAKRIIEQHEGTITVTSELGQGTRVRVSLPQAAHS